MDQEKEKKTAEFYERLKVEDAFDCMGAVIKTTKSKTGKFTSVSVDVQMKDAQEIIDKYIEVSVIEGIVSL